MSISTASERRAASDFWSCWPTLLPDGSIYAPDLAHIQGGYLMAAGGTVIGTLPESLGGDFTLIGWYNQINTSELPFICWDVGALSVAKVDNGGTHQLQISDGTNPTINVDLTADGSSWFEVIVVRSGTSILVYEGKTLIHTATGWSVIDYGTALAAISGFNVQVYDLRVLNLALVAADIVYYYDDVIEKSGSETQPRW